MPKNTNLFWLDLEMTGLGDDQVIIEIASLVTDANLNILAEGPEIAINRTPEELENMEEWPAKQHSKSGLLARIKNSDINIDEAERQTLRFLKKWGAKGRIPVCGNSIWVDRRFLHKEMPQLENYLNYRMVDVSSLKELVERWYPDSIRPPTKKNSHLAMNDIKESVAELKWYRDHIFKDLVKDNSA